MCAETVVSSEAFWDVDVTVAFGGGVEGSETFEAGDKVSISNMTR